LTISDIPNNLKTGFEKFTATMVALESFRSAAQEGKILGVELPAYEKPEQFANIKKYKAPVYISKLSQEDLNPWLLEKLGTTIENEQRKDQETLQEIIKIVEDQITEKENITEKEEKQQTTNGSILGIWEGIATWTESSTAKEDKTTRTFNFRKDGTATTNVSELLEHCTWTKQ
jgi:hypothetical protein